MMEHFGVPKELIGIDKEKERIEIADKIELRKYIVEEYPTADRLEVEREEID